MMCDNWNELSHLACATVNRGYQECGRPSERRRKKNNLPVWRVPGVVLSRRFFATRGVLLVMKTLEDEWYVVIKAYKCTVSEIWRDFLY